MFINLNVNFIRLHDMLLFWERGRKMGCQGSQKLKANSQQPTARPSALKKFVLYWV